jgi:ankyrin repeat protein
VNSSKRTALIQAAVNGDAAVVKLLLESKADVERKDDAGYTALNYACMYKREAVEQLLRKASQTESRTNS